MQHLPWLSCTTHCCLHGQVIHHAAPTTAQLYCTLLLPWSSNTSRSTYHGPVVQSRERSICAFLHYKRCRDALFSYKSQSLSSLTALSAPYNLLSNGGPERGHHENAPRTGRRLILDERALRRLHRCVTQDRRQTLQDITASINTAIPAPVCSRTVPIALKTQLGISNRIAAKKPFITAKQRVKRLAWAKDHLQWTMVDWERVIWTDEASVEIGKESRIVWRR